MPFASLSEEIVTRIARKALDSALAREGLVRRGIQVSYSDALVARLVALGFDARYGARPLKRAIEHWVMAPLAQQIASAPNRMPSRLRLDVAQDGSLLVKA